MRRYLGLSHQAKGRSTPGSPQPQASQLGHRSHPQMQRRWSAEARIGKWQPQQKLTAGAPHFGQRSRLKRSRQAGQKAKRHSCEGAVRRTPITSKCLRHHDSAGVRAVKLLCGFFASEILTFPKRHRFRPEPTSPRRGQIGQEFCVDEGTVFYVNIHSTTAYSTAQSTFTCAPPRFSLSRSRTSV